MKEILEQYGKTIITSIIVIAITAILMGITINGVSGFGDIASDNLIKLTSADSKVDESVVSTLLDGQQAIHTPNLKVVYNPSVGERVDVSTIFGLAGGDFGVSVTPVMITTSLSELSNDALASGLALIDGSSVCFHHTGTYFLIVDIRQEARLISRVYKVTVDKAR